MKEAIILAGGFGTRLSQVVSDVPKPMAPIADRPFLEILLGFLSDNEFRHVVLSVGHMADKIISHFGASYKDIRLSYEVEKTPLGTGGAVRAAMQHCSNDHVYIFNGDTFLDLEVSELEKRWHKYHLPMIVAREMDDVSRYGCLLIEQDRVTEFCEKGVTGAGLINAGCYVLPTTFLNVFPVGKAFSIEADFLATEVANMHLQVFISRGIFIDIGIPEDYFRAQTILKDY